MRGARPLGWGVLLASIALGADAAAVVDRPVLVSDRFTVLAGDFHVHSFPGDGGLLPWDLADEARRRGLDVIALTNHNQMWSWRLAQWVARSMDPIIVLPGVELTSAGYHLAAIGVETPVAWRQPAAAAAAAIRAQGGVSIAAHPLVPRRSGWDDAAIEAIDGVEAASSGDGLAYAAPFTRRAVVRRPAIAPIGASDFHYFAPLGVCRTFLFVTERTRAGVLDAIRTGRTVACDGRGETYGPAELASTLVDECRAAAAPHNRRWREAISTAGAWLALVALVMLGARRP